MRRVIAALVASMILLLTSAQAQAALQDCTVTATPLAFGAYDPLSASPTDGQGTVTMVCRVTLVALLVPWDIRLSTGSSNSYASRTMKNGSVQLNYNLYRNTTRTQIWGDGTGGTSYESGLTLLAVGTSTLNFTVYGRIPPGQDRGAGSYTDPIIVTLNY